MTEMQRTNHFLKTFLSIILVVAIMVVSIPMGAFETRAAAYSGSGTKKDPYLVQTAEQLNGMRDNLSAHYKLANTIDLSSFGKFTPIGYEGERFTGSFTCDTNADGTPKYAIKNLTVYNDSGEKYGHKRESNAGYVDFVEGKTKWQAGLFGFTDGATITNIAVLNANITNTVVGQNLMNQDWSLNPCMHEPGMSTGILVGGAVNSTISGCMSSGVVNSKTNNSGGLIGYLQNGSLMNSYSTAKVTSSGYYATGGLVGMCDGATITSCFASGNVSGGPTEATTGGLVGQVTEGSAAVITSCYSTGNTSPEVNAFSIFGFRMGYYNYEPSWAMNCYTTGSVLGYSKFVNEGMELPQKNLYILSGVKGRQEGFIAASAADIKAKFATLPDWNTDGELPTLKNVHIIKDEAAYVPGAVTDVPEQNATTTPGQGGSSQQGSANSVNIDDLIDRMNKLPEEDDITLDDYKEIKEIKEEFEALSSDLADKIPAEAITKFKTACNAVMPLVIAQITMQVDELTDVKKLKASDYDKVMAIYADFEFIGDNADLIEPVYVDKLKAAVKKVKELKEKGGDTSGSITVIEWTLIGVLAFVTLCILALNVFSAYHLIKFVKRQKGLSLDEEETEELDEIIES